MSAASADAQAKGLLGQTLVVLGTEFGRMPRINDKDGSDHHNKAFACLLAGPGIGRRRQQGVGDSPTRSAISATGRLASVCRCWRIFWSSRSMWKIILQIRVILKLYPNIL